jgi:hypothetical protein
MVRTRLLHDLVIIVTRFVTQLHMLKLFFCKAGTELLMNYYSPTRLKGQRQIYYRMYLYLSKHFQYNNIIRQHNNSDRSARLGILYAIRKCAHEFCWEILMCPRSIVMYQLKINVR